MATGKRLRVVIVGASGETGSSIMNALLGFPEQFESVALARPESIMKEEFQDFARRGASVQPANFQDVEDLVPLLAGADVVISCLTLRHRAVEEALIDASYRAGVGRYIPSFFGTVAPPRGVMRLRDMKEDVLDRCKRLYLPYTIIDVGWWYRASLPRVPSGALDAAISFPETLIGADGNVESAGVHVADIGTYVARIIADPRTLNKHVFAYSQVTTQNHIWATMERLTGETIPRTYLSKQDAEAILAGGKDVNTADPAATLKQALTAYAYSWAIRGDNTPEHATYLGYLLAKDLYPDVKTKGIDDFIQEIVEGTGSANYYVGRADHPYNRAKAAAGK